MRRILVTGATGGLGQNAVRMLTGKGLAVRATGRNPAIGKALSAMGAQFVELDLASASPEQLAALVENVETVWHCAALSSPWGQMSEFVASNVTATERLAGAAGRAGAQHFIHISTPAIYFDFTHRLDVPESFRPKRYVNAYALTKAMAEDVVRSAVSRFPDMRCVILRPRAIFGPHDNVLMPRLARMLGERGGTLPLPRRGKVRLDVTYVENVVHAMWLSTTVSGLASGTALNITNHEPVALEDVLRRLFQDALNRPFRIVSPPYRLMAGAARGLELLSRFTGKEPALTAYSLGAINYDMTLANAKAIEYLGYSPSVNLAEGIMRTADWMRQHG
jgi:nucleoside-diphosphate-sugar epimerase